MLKANMLRQNQNVFIFIYSQHFNLIFRFSYKNCAERRWFLFWQIHNTLLIILSDFELAATVWMEDIKGFLEEQISQVIAAFILSYIFTFMFRCYKGT